MQAWPQAANRVVNPRTFERGFVAEVSLCGRELGEAGIRTLAKNPRLDLLTALDLRKNGITNCALRALATSPLPMRLISLDLRHNPLTTESLWALSKSPHVGQLRELLVGPKEFASMMCKVGSGGWERMWPFTPEKITRNGEEKGKTP